MAEDSLTLRSVGRLLTRLADVLQRALIPSLVRALPRGVTPNHLTGLRFLLAGVVAWWLLRGEVSAAFLTYLIALVTDALDGGVARFRGRVSRFGSRFDASVDKVLHGVVFLFFWPAAPVLLGLLLVLDVGLFLAGILLVIFRRRQDLSASIFGKWKLAAQALGCFALFWNALLPPLVWPRSVILSIFGLALIFAILSLFSYAHRLVRVEPPREASPF